MTNLPARARMVAHLQQAGLSTARAEANLDAYAHELAEQQREHLRQDGYEPDCVCEGCSACLARDYIDLIDPKVQDTSRDHSS
ncbi:hypothetical protein [Streptomyces aureus]|uniref:hypothetical protein n=1 Tax=Streptomyces aureus TaxID=193461 RepID=UPI000565D061|nr:hypothetical protein [Streptomyces aureus]